MKKIIFILLICILPIFLYAEDLMIPKKDYIAFIIGNYVHGFKEFETSVVGFEDSASIGIYYDVSTQSKDRADKLARRFRKQIPAMLKNYKWAKDIKIIVNVHSEDRTGRGY
jgi:hypothetical protein